MKARIVLLSLTVLFFAITGFAQTPVEEWVSTYARPAGLVDSGNDIELDQQGNVYVVGISENASNQDAIIIKYDKQGNELWSRIWADSTANDLDAFTKLTVDDQGNAYVTGGSVSGGKSKMILVKYDPSGNILWDRIYSRGAGSSNTGHDILISRDGDIYISTNHYDGLFHYSLVKYKPDGTFEWAKEYNGGTGNFGYANHVAEGAMGNIFISAQFKSTSDDFSVLKFDTAGNNLWTRTYDGNLGFGDYIAEITTDSWGNLYVTGSNNFSPTTTIYMTIKYDSTGNISWSKSYKHPGSSQNFPEEISVDDQGNVYVTGRVEVGSDVDIVTIKYDTAGNQLWAVPFDGDAPGVGKDIARQLYVDADGFVYVAGESDDTTSKDYVVIKYDTAGNLIWKVNYNRPIDNGDVLTGMVLDNDRNIYVTGRSNAGVVGNNDIVTIKYNQCLNPPVADFVLDTIGCTGQELVISNNSQNATAFYWFNDTTLIDTLSEPNIVMNDAGNYSLWMVASEGVCRDTSVINNIEIRKTPEKPYIIIATVTGCEGDTFTIFTGNVADYYMWGNDTGIVFTDTTIYYDVTASGNYYLIVDSNGCHSDTSNITVGTFYTRTVVDIGNDTIVCSSDSLVLTATGGTEYYLWNTGDTTTSIVVDTAGTYTIFTVNSNMCGYWDTVEVAFYPEPYIDLGPDTIIDHNQNFTLYPMIVTSGFPISLQWNTGATSDTLNVDGPGIYWVEMTDVNGCTVRDSVNVTVHIGISSLSEHQSLEVYPNPFSQTTTIVLPNNHEQFIMRLLDISGKVLLYEPSVSGSLYSLQRDNIPIGIYFIELSGSEMYRAKVMVY